MSLRTVETEGFKKKPVGLSFTGRDGYKALDILAKHKDYGYSKSNLVVELLNIYGEARKKYGDLAMYKLLEFAQEETK